MCCAAPLGHEAAAGFICGTCQRHPPKYTFARAAFAYAPPLDRLILGLKYHGKLEHARALGQLLFAYLETLPGPRPDVIVPVPLHRRRLRERGYNQALEIARPVARQFGIPVEFRRVRRNRATQTQTELPPRQRRKNVRNAFRADLDLSGMCVAVVDDVMTTGHTVNSLATCLRRAGAADVIVWTVARAG